MIIIFPIGLFLILYILFAKQINNWILNNKMLLTTSIVILILSLIIKSIFNNYDYFLITPFVVILILIILNLLFPNLFDYYKKKKNEKNVITKLIINYLIIYILMFIGNSFFISLIYFILLLCFIIFYKLFPQKHNLLKSIALSTLPIITVILLSLGFDKVTTIMEWNKIKTDYETVNKKVLEYRKSLCQNDKCNFDIVSLDEDSKEIEYSKEEIQAINRIKEYYRNQEIITLSPDKIVYGDYNGYFEIVYSISGKKIDEENRNIKYLGNNWYKIYVW